MHRLAALSTRKCTLETYRSIPPSYKIAEGPSLANHPKLQDGSEATMWVIMQLRALLRYTSVLRLMNRKIGFVDTIPRTSKCSNEHALLRGRALGLKQRIIKA